MKKIFSIIILYLFCSVNANAIASLGVFDCGAILKYKEIKDSQESVEDWLNGFLTAAQLGRKPLKEVIFQVVMGDIFGLLNSVKKIL